MKNQADKSSFTHPRRFFFFLVRTISTFPYRLKLRTWRIYREREKNGGDQHKETKIKWNVCQKHLHLPIELKIKRRGEKKNGLCAATCSELANWNRKKRWSNLTKDSCHKAEGEVWGKSGEEPRRGVQTGPDLLLLQVAVEIPVIVVEQTRQLVHLNLIGGTRQIRGFTQCR